jgi:hypothetical protein
MVALEEKVEADASRLAGRDIPGDCLIVQNTMIPLCFWGIDMLMLAADLKC